MEKVKDELELIREANERKELVTHEVLEFAEKHPESELHKQYEWDDTVAGRNWRLWQTRNLIRKIVVTIEGREKEPIKIPLYHNVRRVSLAETEDTETGVGRSYDTILNIMSDKDKRSRLLDQAYIEMRTFRKKYTDLKELSPVLDAMEKVGA